MSIPCVTRVVALGKSSLRITFDNGDIKIYDVKAQMYRLPQFKNFDFYHAFNQVQVESGGVGVHFDEVISISRSELWENSQYENDELEFD